MRWLLCFLALMSTCAFGQEVARVFGRSLSAADLRWTLGEPPAQAARDLRSWVLMEADERFIAANKLQATPDEIAAYARWEEEFQARDRARRTARRAELENMSSLDDKQLQELDVLRSLAKYDAERPPATPEVHAWWVERYKLQKALYEKYGGRVGITKWGPDPVGATEALLREHEKKGDLVIRDATLSAEFWGALAREPRYPAKPEQIDFTYYWLKPPATK
jgi:hypothetical protein